MAVGTRWLFVWDSNLYPLACSGLHSNNNISSNDNHDGDNCSTRIALMPRSLNVNVHCSLCVIYVIHQESRLLLLALGLVRQPRIEAPANDRQRETEISQSSAMRR